MMGVSADDVNSLDSEAFAPGYSGYQGYPRGRGRGRGRARGAFVPRGGRGRGRGAAAFGSASMKLDNRPKKLIIKGMEPDDEAGLSAAQTWFEVCLSTLCSLQVAHGRSVERRPDDRVFTGREWRDRGAIHDASTCRTGIFPLSRVNHP